MAYVSEVGLQTSVQQRFSINDIIEQNKRLNEQLKQWVRLAGNQDGDLFENVNVEEALKHEEISPLALEIPGSRSQLHEHQKVAVAWMMEKERNGKPGKGLGGLLLDDAGMGKSLTILSFIKLCGHGLPTLIVVPARLLGVWEEQIRTHFQEGSFKYTIFHRKNKKKGLDNENILDYDIVLTSYTTLTRYHHQDDIFNKTFFDFTWHRVVLDEAHYVRNQNSGACNSVLALKKQFGWAITGTPIVNKIDDLFPLFKFVNVNTGNEKVWRNVFSKITEKKKEEKAKLSNAPTRTLPSWCKPLSTANHDRQLNYELTWPRKRKHHEAFFNEDQHLEDSEGSIPRKKAKVDQAGLTAQKESEYGDMDVEEQSNTMDSDESISEASGQEDFGVESCKKETDFELITNYEDNRILDSSTLTKESQKYNCEPGKICPLWRTLINCAIRRTSSCIKLPEKQEFRIDIHLSAPERAIYDIIYTFYKNDMPPGIMKRITSKLTNFFPMFMNNHGLSSSSPNTEDNFNFTATLPIRESANFVETSGTALEGRGPEDDSFSESPGATNVLKYITHLRQAACHPALALKHLDNKELEDRIIRLFAKIDDIRNTLYQLASCETYNCSWCKTKEASPETTMLRVPCGHVYCEKCFLKILTAAKIDECKSCLRDKNANNEVKKIDLMEISNQKKERKSNDGFFVPPRILHKNLTEIDRWSLLLNDPSLMASTKVETLVDMIKETPTKVVVVSQWVEYLNMIENRLRQEGISSLRIDGTIAVEHRFKIIEQFQTQTDDIRIILVTLGAASEGITLTSACQLFHMDPWWTSAKSEQASARIYRLGQQKTVCLYYIHAKHTIEDQIELKRDKKQRIADATLGST